MGVFAREAKIGNEVNIEGWKQLRPLPVGTGDGVGAALREAVNDRHDRVPPDMEALLCKLDRRRAA